MQDPVMAYSSHISEYDDEDYEEGLNPGSSRTD